MIRRGLTGERLSALFLLGLVLLLPPLIGVFDKPVLVAGIPLLYLYLFAAWGGLILLTALAVERPAAEDDVANDEPGMTGAGGEGSTASGSSGSGA
ncbi:MAG: hypothetical protein R3D62_21490 [Xanthobacteraceae bacterium]